MTKQKLTVTLLAAAAMLVSSCDLLDCTQADVSCLRIEIYDTYGVATTLPDTLTVMAYGTDSILVNRNLDTQELLLPLSYNAEADTFILHYYGKTFSWKDTLYVKKTNDLYFESPDCPTVMMHTLKEIAYTNRFINSARLVNNKVNFEEVTHMKLFVQE
ncbi:MAG: hypothetical protein K2J00_01275 [Bacteroidaceae bacterium]|nr:hypothetical protein [Bacteroidaceae bacterium]